MNSEIHHAIQQLLETHNTMTLATCEHDQPWATSVFYASDAELNLYFVSDSRTRHGRHLTANQWAAGAINPDCANWSEICGVQFEGQVTELDGVARVTALGCYLAKFSQIKTLFEQPRDNNEETIAARLLAATLYKLSPNWIRLIDNQRYFGYKAELILK